MDGHRPPATQRQLVAGRQPLVQHQLAATLPEHVSSAANHVDLLYYVTEVEGVANANGGLQTAVSNLRHQYDRVVEESSQASLEDSINNLKTTANHFTTLSALVRLSFFYLLL